MNLGISFILFDDNSIVINIGFKNTFSLLGVILLCGEKSGLLSPRLFSLILLDGGFLKLLFDWSTELFQEIENLLDCIGRLTACTDLN